MTPTGPRNYVLHTGLFDKEGREIHLGDKIRINRPYRETQVHYGVNIPRPFGIFTEPLEPEIDVIESEVLFGLGMFYISTQYDPSPLLWDIQDYSTRDHLIHAFGSSPGVWDEDLEYLLEKYPPNTEEELMRYVSGCEIIDTNGRVTLYG